MTSTMTARRAAIIETRSCCQKIAATLKSHPLGQSQQHSIGLCVAIAERCALGVAQGYQLGGDVLQVCIPFRSQFWLHG
jgi:hypothetical protein